jgi:hypothetical protein
MSAPWDSCGVAYMLLFVANTIFIFGFFDQSGLKFLINITSNTALLIIHTF